MREIKFRAWDGKEMWTGFNILPTDIIVPPAWKKSEEVLEYMQYTGLKDKNGVEIYEGDVVKVTRHERSAEDSNIKSPVHYENIFDVKFDKGTFYCGSTFANWLYSEFDNLIREIEVIGNIYQNPELLAK